MTDGEFTGDIFLIPSDKTAAATARATRSIQDDLVERARAGDERAFAEIYRKYSPMVHGIAMSRMPPADADDLVQEVFIAAHKNLASLRDLSALGPWLAKIARNRAANFHRSRRDAEEIYDEIAGARRPTAEAFEVLEMLRTLPDAYREPLMLRLVEGMTGPEIAEATEMTHDSVRVNLYRGMKMLRGKLGLEERK